MYQDPFRFLDLPAELRLWVYESIEIPTTWYTLDRIESALNEWHWPVPPKAQVYESRITLIRPHCPLEILCTSRLVNKEAGPILKRKMKHCRLQPIPYLVDYNAAWALVSPTSPLRSCLDIADDRSSELRRGIGRSFVRLCRSCLVRTPMDQDDAPGPQVIEITISHKSGVVYGREVLDLMLWLGWLEDLAPTRLVIIYKTPLPKSQHNSRFSMQTTEAIVDSVLQNFPRDTEMHDDTEVDDPGNPKRGVFIRPLDEKAFEGHEKGLERY
ncbi:hypothetical protein DE146DRAFT_622319 [Phaeosphaeria sp. MPI-PUGE-AT-0046c]|nr:hypothetical protein DE146DRAFT_622319 [Phaeosphaeria sp. MPI-PUGE-AT-0046c]